MAPKRAYDSIDSSIPSAPLHNRKNARLNQAAQISVVPQQNPDVFQIMDIDQTSSVFHVANTRQIFPFLTLPGEMRNLIYHYSLNWNDEVFRLEALHTEQEKLPCRPSELEGQAFEDWKARAGPRVTSTPNVLLLCKQITQEALGILYGTPLFITAKSMRAASIIPQAYTSHADTDGLAILSPSQKRLCTTFTSNIRKLRIEIPDFRLTPNDDVLAGRNKGQYELSGLFAFLTDMKLCFLPMHFLNLEDLRVGIEGGTFHKMEPAHIQEVAMVCTMCFDGSWGPNWVGDMMEVVKEWGISDGLWKRFDAIRKREGRSGRIN